MNKSKITGSSKLEVDGSIKIVHDYLRTDPSQRGVDIPIFKVKQGYEPPNFTGFFGPWDANAFKQRSSYNDIKTELQSKNQLHLFMMAGKDKLVPNGMAKHNELLSFNQYPKFSYDDLIKPADELPELVDNAAREVYLNEDDFKKIFNMTFDQFVEKPSWKQKELKREVHLF